MKTTAILILLTATSVSLLGQPGTTTYHQNIRGVFEGPHWLEPDWTLKINWQLVVNQVRKINAAGDVEIRYTNNYKAYWEFYNTVTGERKISPENQNVTGVFSFGADHFTNDRHWLYHFVNDPVFGSYHYVARIIWHYDPSTGFMEIEDIQNEWLREP